jgi:hypothetical protein
MKKELLLIFHLRLVSTPHFVDKIIQLANNKTSSVICVANVHMYTRHIRAKSFYGSLTTLEIVNLMETFNLGIEGSLWDPAGKSRRKDLLPDLLMLVFK